MQTSYLLPNVFKLLYTFSYFFQTSIDLTCGDKKNVVQHQCKNICYNTNTLCTKLDSVVNPHSNCSYNFLTLKFSFVSHGSDYDNVHIPSVTMLATHRKQNVYKHIVRTMQQSTHYIGFI